MTGQPPFFSIVCSWQPQLRGIRSTVGTLFKTEYHPPPHPGHFVGPHRLVPWMKFPLSCPYSSFVLQVLVPTQVRWTVITKTFFYLSHFPVSGAAVKLAARQDLWLWSSSAEQKGVETATPWSEQLASRSSDNCSFQSVRAGRYIPPGSQKKKNRCLELYSWNGRNRGDVL